MPLCRITKTRAQKVCRVYRVAADGILLLNIQHVSALSHRTAVRPTHLIPRLQGILADAVSQWPTLDCGPCSLSPAAVRQAWVASLAPVFDKPQHSH